jgi:hypothetical protein
MGRALEAFAAHQGLMLGHAPLIEVMRTLFADKRPARRRLARSSNEVSTDPSVAALKDTALDAEPEEDTDVRAVHQRAHKPTLPLKPAPSSEDDRATIPIVARGTRDGMVPIDHPSRLPTPVPLEEQSTSIVDPNIEVRFAHSKIPLEDRPTPIAEGALIDPPTHRDAKPIVLDTQTHTLTSVEELQAPDRPTPPHRPSPAGGISIPRTVTGTPPPPRRRPSDPPALPLPLRPPTGPNGLVRPPSLPPIPARPSTGPNAQVVARAVTGPQLPQHLEDAPTEIAALGEDREDPTDVSGVMPLPPVPRPQVTPTGQVVVREKWGPAYVATAVVNRYRKTPWLPKDAATRTWLLLLGLFGVALITAMLVAFL